MQFDWLALLCAVLAASATILGGAMVFVKRRFDDHFLKYSIAFGAGFMLGAAALAMLPESFKISTLSATMVLSRLPNHSFF